MDLNHPLLALADQAPPFPRSYPQFTRLDNSVFCQICKELYQGPVSVGCGHSFCSMCIRSSLEVMKKCPICNEAISEGQIRRNRALEEITDAWEDSRPTILDLTRPTKKRPPPEPNSKASSSTSNGKRPRQSSPVKEVESGDEIELTESDEGECPLCSARLAIASIPMHIERGCPPPMGGLKGASGNQKADWKRVFAGTRKGKEVELKRITKPNYALTTPNDLRSILGDHSLPITGDKAVLSHRLQEWIILYNSNLDTSHPKSLPALRAQLAAVEEARRRDREKGKADQLGELETAVGLEKYGKDKRSEFERLRREVIERNKSAGGKENAIEID